MLQREGKRYHVQLFSGVSHGFAVKGDPEDPYQSKFSIVDVAPRWTCTCQALTSCVGWCKEQSLRAMIDWFTLWLVDPSS